MQPFSGFFLKCKSNLLVKIMILDPFHFGSQQPLSKTNMVTAQEKQNSPFLKNTFYSFFPCTFIRGIFVQIRFSRKEKYDFTMQ
jgi:hypothetical protein